MQDFKATDREKIIEEIDMGSESMSSQSAEFLEMYNKVAEFIRELMQQNKLLQQRVKELQEGKNKIRHGLGTEVDQELEQQVERLRQVKKELMDQYHHVEDENKDFLDRYLEIESENNNLANLYVASYQLHSTLDFLEVLDIITEIIINLIGAQAFAILMLNEKHGVLQPVKAEGMNLEDLPTIPMGEEIIGSIAESGEIYYREETDIDALIDIMNPLVCVPLKIKEQVIGVIVVYQLLPQKEKLVRVDYELFTLLAAHAATAMFGARLYSDSVRKRDTIKGFLDLLTH